MANDSITFHCPACSIKLTVPGSLAGVIGPCPSCQNQIQAPYPAAAPPQTPAPYEVPAPQQAPVYYPAPAPQQVPVSDQAPTTYQLPVQQLHAPAAPQPSSLQPTTDVDYPLPVPPVVIPAPPTESHNPALVRPEPRQLPTRTSNAEPVARPMPERIREPELASAKKAKKHHSHSRNFLVRLFVPLLTIIAIIGVVYGVLKILKNNGTSLYPPRTTTPAGTSQTPEDGVHSHPFQPQDVKMPDVLPVSDPLQPIIVEPPPDLPSGLDVANPGLEAEDVVHAFLAAKTLSERLPMLETKTPETELKNSCLAGPLPTSSGVVMEFRETNPVEQVIDFYFGVDFDAGENRVNPHTVLVRKRGTGTPKIVADPFLDCFGGRLAAYASQPTDKAGIFEVIVSPLAECNDSKIPKSDKKHTLKLLARDQAKEIARAYFGKQSKIGHMLEDRTYSLSFGKALPCTVMLRWNTEDNKQIPYLEALDITSLDWNP